MNEDGMFLRESFMEIPQLELLFVTPRGFLYQMNRISDEIWQKEQNGRQFQRTAHYIGNDRAFFR
jgi:hypothetical protein